jgi:hypothetical protein
MKFSRKKFTRYFTITIEPAVYEKIVDRCSELKISVSEFCRNIITEFIISSEKIGGQNEQHNS